MRRVEETIRKYKYFYRNRAAGNILVTTEFPVPPLPDNKFPKLLHEIDFHRENVDFARAHVRGIRWFSKIRKIDDDWIPGMFPEYGHGVRMALLSGAEVNFSPGTSWAKPTLEDWSGQEDLKLDENSFWLEKVVELNRTWKEMDEGDLLIMPFLYGSPLDYAWFGLRGDRLWTDLSESPDQAKKLLEFCAGAILRLEEILANNSISGPRGRALWGLWVPEGTIAVNGDSADLISPKLYRQSGLEYDEKIFKETGGGFYHHHIIGLQQALTIAGIENLHIQNLSADSNARPLDVILKDDAQAREDLIQASLKKPVHIFGAKPNQVKQSLDILKEGRFVLKIDCPDREEAKDIVREVRKVSNIN